MRVLPLLLTAACAAAPPADARLEPVAGELTITQLLLDPGLVPRPGESAILVGPDGTLVLLDLGAEKHADRIRDEVRRLNTTVLVPDRGYSSRNPLQVDWIVLTHFHDDHVGSFKALLTGDDALDVTGGLIHRGFTDLGPAVGEADFETICELMRGPLRDRNRPLCDSDQPVVCTVSREIPPDPAVSCPGLSLGRIADPSDDDASAPGFIDLGGGARMVFLAASAHTLDGPVASFGHDDSGMENARSVVGYVEHGAFRYTFGGDLTGSGEDGNPDVESAVSLVLSATLGPLGADVIHAHHHARKTSSNAAIVAALAPNDGRARNVVAGINGAYVGSPHAEVVHAWLDDDRLGEGAFWATDVAHFGTTGERVVEADGDVIVRTRDGGDSYVIQAFGTKVVSDGFDAVRTLP